MRVPMRKALLMSCVTMIDVTFDFSVRLMINSSITELITGSRPAEGSSKRISSGSMTIARARLTRFFGQLFEWKRDVVAHITRTQQSRVLINHPNVLSDAL